VQLLVSSSNVSERLCQLRSRPVPSALNIAHPCVPVVLGKAFLQRARSTANTVSMHHVFAAAAAAAAAAL